MKGNQLATRAACATDPATCGQSVTVTRWDGQGERRGHSLHTLRTGITQGRPRCRSPDADPRSSGCLRNSGAPRHRPHRITCTERGVVRVALTEESDLRGSASLSRRGDPAAMDGACDCANHTRVTRSLRARDAACPSAPDRCQTRNPASSRVAKTHTALLGRTGTGTTGDPDGCGFLLVGCGSGNGESAPHPPRTLDGHALLRHLIGESPAKRKGPEAAGTSGRWGNIVTLSCFTPLPFARRGRG